MFVYAHDAKEETLPNGVKRRIKGHIKDLMLVELVWKAGMAGDMHSHPHRQAGYVVKGSFTAMVDGQKTILREGDCYYTENNIPHGLTALEDDSVLLDIFTPRRDDFIA